MTPMDDSDDRDLDALMRALDPWPADRPVDPALAANALALVEKEIDMSDTATPVPRPRRRRLLALAAVLAVLAVLGGMAAVRALDDGSTPAGQGRALGDAFASCLAFSLDVLAQQPVAFDGTVTAIDGQEVTFDVERWYRGGDGDTAVTRSSGLVSGAPELNGGVGFEEGGRYLVSGDRDGDAIVPAICGLTVEHSDGMADDWERAFGS
jgi:hypothetical protein